MSFEMNKYLYVLKHVSSMFYYHFNKYSGSNYTSVHCPSLPVHIFRRSLSLHYPYNFILIYFHLMLLACDFLFEHSSKPAISLQNRIFKQSLKNVVAFKFAIRLEITRILIGTARIVMRN